MSANEDRTSNGSTGPTGGDHDCEAVCGQLSDYLEGELGPEEAREVERALASCPRCQAELEALRSTLGRLHGLREPAPPSFLSDIKGQIRERSRGRFFGKRWLLFGRIPFEWVSFVMIVAMLLYYIITLQGSPTDVSPAD